MTDIDPIDPPEEEPTELDELLEDIATLEAINIAMGGRNIWILNALQGMYEERDRWFDEEGNRIPVEPEELTTDNISPEETHNAEGWFEFAGMELSNARSNGCFMIRRHIETAKAWRDNPEQQVTRYGGSARLYRMAGYQMLENPWHMLPTHVLHGTGRFRVDDYPVVEPAVPFSDMEKEIWERNFENRHFSGAALAGGLFQASNLSVVPGETVKGHLVWTYANHPHRIVGKLNQLFYTGRFMRRAYYQQPRIARDIDAGLRGRVPGYSLPSEQSNGIDVNDPTIRDWYEVFEATRQSKRLSFES